MCCVKGSLEQLLIYKTSDGAALRRAAPRLAVVARVKLLRKQLATAKNSSTLMLASRSAHPPNEIWVSFNLLPRSKTSRFDQVSSLRGLPKFLVNKVTNAPFTLSRGKFSHAILFARKSFDSWMHLVYADFDGIEFVGETKMA